VIPRNLRNGFHFGRLEAAQPAITDEVGRVLVVVLVADVDPEVVQQRRELEPLTLARPQTVQFLRLVEDGQGQTCHLLRMFCAVVTAFGELDDTAAADVGDAIDLADVRAVLLDVIEHEPLAQGKVAQRDVVGVESGEQRIEQDDAGDGQVGAARIQSGYFQALVERQRCQTFAQPPQ
jgi:hypothetical protein